MTIKMEEYFITLLEQIRCKKARPLVEKELRSHIEDQTEANLAAGMDAQTAVSAAVKDMGDPIETGISLDRIHRPKLSKSILLVMTLICLCSVLIHIAIGLRLSTDSSTMPGNTAYIKQALFFHGAGFVLMLLCCHLDYSFLAKYAKRLAALFFSFLFLEVFFFSDMMLGAHSYGNLGGFRFSLIQLSFLCIPLYGALLYHYRNKGYRGIVKCILWMLPPCITCHYMPCFSQTVLLFFMMSLLLSAAVLKDWFFLTEKKRKKRSFLTVYWSAALLLPLLWIGAGVFFQWFAAYQTARIKAFLGFGPEDSNYIANLLHDYLASARLFGSSGKEIHGYLPGYNSDYILTFISSYYGLAAAFFICLLLLFLGGKAVHLSLRQKSLPGMMIGCGCGLVFLTVTLLNIFETLGLLPLSQTFLPFFSFGGSGILISYILAGIALSVYRFQNIVCSAPDVAKDVIQLEIRFRKSN